MRTLGSKKPASARLALVIVLALTILAPAVPALAAPAQGRGSEVQRWQSRQINQLTEDLEKSEKTIERIFLPVTVLIGILALGGGLGVVFSIRDQRRVSQLHELTVTGEVSSQRRSEQSYASFLEQSQTTLSLVNDTLGLAKEATDRATKSVKEKTELQRDAIEERAQKLMLDVFNSNEFELVVVDPVRREELHAIGREVRGLEGHMGLQDVELKDYAKFVKALDQFLLDEIEAALQALQLAAQSAVVGDLQRFVEYWLGYMLTTVGMYAEAVQKFEHDEESVPPGSPQYLQLERIKMETRFFALAKPDTNGKYWDKEKKVDTRLPDERFRLVATLLDDLELLAEKVEKSDDHEAKVHTKLEVARTRADVLEWVAYDKSHLDEPLEEEAIEEASAVVAPLAQLEKPSELLGSSLLDVAAEKPDVLRYWALKRAQEICEKEVSEEKFGEPSMEVDFALAECYFKLRDPRAIKAFEKLEKAISGFFGEHREKRHEVALQQSLLICQCRLFTLRKEAGGQRREQEEIRQILGAERDTREKLNQMPRGRVTIFSHIQRRNLTREEFAAEVDEIVAQEKIEPSSE